MQDNNQIIFFTEKATAHIKKAIAQKGGNAGFRLSVKKTGCSGLSYVPEIVDAAKENDLSFITQDGLQVFIDPNCVDFVKGTILDFVDEGLGNRHLEFRNPNVKGQCGCGESFKTE